MTLVNREVNAVGLTSVGLVGAKGKMHVKCPAQKLSHGRAYVLASGGC